MLTFLLLVRWSADIRQLALALVLLSDRLIRAVDDVRRESGELRLIFCLDVVLDFFNRLSNSLLLPYLEAVDVAQLVLVARVEQFLLVAVEKVFDPALSGDLGVVDVDAGVAVVLLDDLDLVPGVLEQHHHAGLQLVDRLDDVEQVEVLLVAVVTQQVLLLAAREFILEVVALAHQTQLHQEPALEYGYFVQQVELDGHDWDFVAVRLVDCGDLHVKVAVPDHLRLELLLVHEFGQLPKAEPKDNEYAHQLR